MALTNRQYDAIMNGYDRQQYRDYREQRARMDEVYEKIPRIRQIEESISSVSVAQAEKVYDAEPGALEALRQELTALCAERSLLLESAGYPSDYLEMHYACPECQDTGYVGRKKCRCFRQQEIRLLYSSSRLESALKAENFSTFSWDAYDDAQREAMYPVVESCRKFIETFGQEFQNLLFYGPVGTGKTFLSRCIAKELLDRRHSVVYFTSFQLFELLSPADGGDFRQRHEALLDSELLILDDMGTEVPNTFTVSKLFGILNERAMAKKPVIISTNLSLREFRDVYSERIFSRISSSYTLLKFDGKDIRLRQKIQGRPT